MLVPQIHRVRGQQKRPVRGVEVKMSEVVNILLCRVWIF